MDDRPSWARRILVEREARGWSQRDAVRALRVHSAKALPSDESMIRSWKAWERGEHLPIAFYQRLLAKTFGTTTYAIFPHPSRRDGEAELLAVSGMGTLEIVSRLRVSDLDNASLDALRITVDRLCGEYPYLPGEQLVVEGRRWLRRIVELQSQRLTLHQHREVIALAGWLALLVGCLEYDMGQRGRAESTRRAALGLGRESGNAEVVGWAHEMRAWFALTSADPRGTIIAADAGRAAAPHHGVAVQLAGQKAKAWARLGDRRQAEVALEDGRHLLETLPYPDNLAHHFVVDPAKFDFYSMDCHLLLGEDRIARTLAQEVIRAGTAPDGRERVPMRLSEARFALAIVAARNGDPDQALAHGHRALDGDRKSLPHLLMNSRDLATELRARYPNAAGVRDYLHRLRALSTSAGT